MKKLKFNLFCIFGILGVIIIILLATFYYKYIMYTSAYKIIPEKAKLVAAILQSMNRPEAVTNNIDIKKELNIDNKKFILFTFDNKKGSADFTKGNNQKYKIGRVGYSTSLTSNEVIKTNKAKYIFITFINYNNKTKYVKVLLNNQEYRIDIPQEKYVIAYCKAPSNAEVEYIEINNFKFYSDKNLDITQEVLFEQ